MIELRVNNERLDLKADVIIALTYAVNDIGSIETRQGVSSNQFDIPITDNNLRILGYPTLFNVNQNVSAFKKISAELYEDELRIAKGYIQINNPSLQNDTIPVNFFGDNADVFSDIRGKSIRELTFPDFSHVFKPSVIEDSFTNTEGYKYNLIDRNGLNFVQGDNFPCQAWTISAFQSTIVKEIIESIGYKLTGSLLNDALYKKTVIPNTNNKFLSYNVDSGVVKDAYVALDISDNGVGIGGAYTYTSGTEQTLVFASDTFGQFSKPLNNGDLFSYASNSYVADEFIVANVNFNLRVQLDDALDPATNVTLRLKLNGTTIASQSESVGASLVNIQINQSVSLETSDALTLTIESDTSDVAVNFAGFSTINNLSNNNVLNVTVLKEVIEGAGVNLNANLPDIDQADFLKDVVFDHNVLITANLSTKTISLDLKKYSYNNFLDWSKLIDLSQNVEVNYTDLIQKYNQINDVKRAENEDIFVEKYNDDNIIKYGDGQFNIDNNFLDSRGSIFESKFSGSLTINSLDTSMPLVYIQGNDISDAATFEGLDTNKIYVSLDSDLESFLEDVNERTCYCFKTGASNLAENEAYSIIEVVKNETDQRYEVEVNATFTPAASADGIFRMVKREEQAEPRKLIDAGNYNISDLHDTKSSFNITSSLDSPEDSISITSIPYFYFWNPDLGKVTDNNTISLSYGSANIISRCVPLLDQYYTNTIDILQNGKMLKASFRLTQVDIFNLDFNKLIYLNFTLKGQTINGYFILNKIEEYTGADDSTVVELIKY